MATDSPMSGPTRSTLIDRMPQRLSVPRTCHGFQLGIKWALTGAANLEPNSSGELDRIF